MNAATLDKVLNAIERLKNCGIGSGGFQPGNSCARGGGGSVSSGGGGSQGGDSSGHGLKKVGKSSVEKAKKYGASVLDKEGKVIFDHARSSGAVSRMVVRKEKGSYITDYYSRGKNEDNFMKESTGTHLGSAKKMDSLGAIAKATQEFGSFNRVGPDSAEIWKDRKWD